MDVHEHLSRPSIVELADAMLNFGFGILSWLILSSFKIAEVIVRVKIERERQQRERLYMLKRELRKEKIVTSNSGEMGIT